MSGLGTIIAVLAITFAVLALVVAQIAKTRKPSATSNPFRKDF